MATFTAIKNRAQGGGAMGRALDYVEQEKKTLWEERQLVTGWNCVARSAYDEMMTTKRLYEKTDGRMFYQFVQSFDPAEEVTPEEVHAIGLELAQKLFPEYEVVVATHMNTDHIHNHIIMNSVNFETGRKFHQSAREMQQAKEFSNQLCLQYGLSVTETKADPHRIPAWKKKLRQDIKQAMEMCYDREQFIRCMEAWGYGVKWEEGHRHITYTTPENIRCRDNKLFDQTLLRENMEHYFAMGGREYLETRREWREFGEPEPTLDDAVCGLASIFEALETGDNDRFHLETLHHSEEEIELILRRGGKIDHSVQYAVDDESEEYEQYHGFSMSM